MSLSKRETDILDAIVVASESDPQKPEFPSDDPKFPATPTYQIDVEGFSNVWIKDESYNPTGTHKDRMAWEIIVTYRDFLLAKQRNCVDKPLPSMSIISSWSAAIAIQTQLRKYWLPDLHVLVDNSIDQHIFHYLQNIGCKIFQTDLGEKALTYKEILQLTHNLDWFDITSSQALDPTTRFYDWLSYEIINSSPDYCFIPFGTGHLFENVLNVNKKEISTQHHDLRFSWNMKTLWMCNFMWATTNDPLSKAAEKLYSPHLPFAWYDEQWIKLYKYAGFCGWESGVFVIKESFLDQAIDFANTLKIQCEPSGIAWLALFLEMKINIPFDKKILIVNTGKVKYIK